MPNLASARKRVRQGEKLNIANSAQRSTMRTAIKKVRLALAAGDAEAAKTALGPALRLIGKAVRKGLLHSNTGSRYSARLSSQVAKFNKAAA